MNDSTTLTASVVERCFKSVADYTYDWESWHSPSGRLLWVNQAVMRTTGRSVDECMSMEEYPLPMIMPNDHERMRDILKLAQQRMSGENVEFGCLHRDGIVRWMSISWQPMYDKSGDYLGFRTSIRDVTELRKLRDQLRLHAEHLEQLVQERTEKLRQLENRQKQMEKLAALGQLAAGVAHEINNPLAGMRNAFELIKSTLSPDHEHYDLLELVDREIERISGIVHQMYQLYKRVPQQPAEFDLGLIIREVIAMLENVAVKRKIKIRLSPIPVDGRLWLAEGEVKQILYNVIRNAIQASSNDSYVDVTIEPRAKETIIHIQDYGSGIESETLPQIFDPFFSTKLNDTHAGMGLGLSVSRSLVEAMGGRIDVVTSLHRGTCFSIVLPQRIEVACEAHHEY